jgi:hypothetical protein
MSDFIIGLVVLFFAYRIFRAVLEALGAVKSSAARKQTESASSTPQPAASVYRGPRDTTARPSAHGSVPRAALRMKNAVATPLPRKPMQQSGSPFIIDKPRRFPVIGILAVATIIILISSCYAWISEQPQRPAPGRNADHAIHLEALA